MGVEEPLALIHAPNESVDPGEIARVATAEARFLQEYAARRAEPRTEGRGNFDAMSVQLNHTIVHAQRQARDGAPPGRDPRPPGADHVRPVPRGQGRQRRLPRRRRRPRAAALAALRVPGLRGGVRRDPRAHPGARPAVLGRPVPPAARRDQPRRRRSRALLGRPQRPHPRDPHGAVRRLGRLHPERDRTPWPSCSPLTTVHPSRAPTSVIGSVSAKVSAVLA